jgi:2'-5' RNA ligase
MANTINYNIALVFDKETRDEIISYSKKFKFKKAEERYDLGDGSTPHATILKFRSEPLNEKAIEKIIQALKPIRITFSGITALPERNGNGFWLEISILKNKQLEDILEKLIKLTGQTPLNETGDLFRPHITINRVYEKNIKIPELPETLLRKTTIATLKLGQSGKSPFKFYEAK